MKGCEHCGAPATVEWSHPENGLGEYRDPDIRDLCEGCAERASEDWAEIERS